ncbi:hypothetical protein ABIA33_006508 [Streptacidiphilus sp. MAP12-16]
MGGGDDSRRTHRQVRVEGKPVMHAAVSDRIHIKGTHVGDHEQIGEVLEVRGAQGEPPYLVRFDDGHEGLIYPGPDCTVEIHRAQT